jgi:hypothetical protein
MSFTQDRCTLLADMHQGPELRISPVREPAKHHADGSAAAYVVVIALDPLRGAIATACRGEDDGQYRPAA